MVKRIGAAFGDELRAAGLAGLPFSWGDDGTFTFDERMTKSQIAAVQVVFDAHDPNTPAPKSTLTIALENARTVEDLKVILIGLLK